MSTHLYCVVPHQMRGAGAIPPGLSGVGGGRVRELPLEGIVAWVSDVEQDIRIWGSGVREHDAVVEAALGTGTTPVPARFGQRFDDDDACRAALVSRASSVESLLATMQGFIEMTIIITPSTRRMLRDLEPVIPEMLEPPRRGRGPRYLDKLRSAENATGAFTDATDELAERVRIATADVVRRSTVHRALTPMPLRTISHLVARTDLQNYARAISAVPSNGECRFLLFGPRAPYSFCGLSDDSSGTHGMNLAD
jgi:hypothetical protein